MSARFDSRFTGSSDPFAAAAARANQLALENAESMFGLQLKAFEQNVEALAGFFGECAGAHDLGAYQKLWPKGLQVARDNLERVASASQDAVGLGLKTSSELGDLARTQFQAMARKQAAAPRSRQR